MAFQAATAQKLAQYGKWPGQNDPQAPRPSLMPGKPDFNPFEGRWIE